VGQLFLAPPNTSVLLKEMKSPFRPLTRLLHQHKTIILQSSIAREDLCWLLSYSTRFRISDAISRRSRVKFILWSFSLHLEFILLLLHPMIWKSIIYAFNWAKKDTIYQKNLSSSMARRDHTTTEGRYPTASKTMLYPSLMELQFG
jgi:hypothetical protein